MENQGIERHITLYWNNPSCLKKAVEGKLDATASRWKAQKNATVDFDYYGLIEDMLMEDRLEEDLQQGRMGADVLVSTDMQLFHRKDLLLGNLPLFQPIEDWFPIRKEFAEMAHAQGYFQPGVVVPVVMIKNKEMLEETTEIRGWEDLLDPSLAGKIAISSTDKPAGKSILKGYWYLYGEEGLHTAKEHFSVVSNPAAVFDAVDRGQYPLGIVPLLFASGPGKSGQVEKIWPEEGLFVVISYVAVRADAGPEVREILLESLYSQEIQDLYSQRGLMIPVHPEVEPKQELMAYKGKLLYPSWEWVEQKDMSLLED
ncbi:ABC transporter substrate-binding protein [Tindallia californiensis]|uniref:ABC-type Fe3+ transport system, substrate-binding protein n=1 Tax=Tindallia californiensis TaxID=159292 RepID=A0A1H3R5A9_9FIRM|nr:ABC transporter substrate-binding protein [Tindallia californiensis]SDZ20786.1 ABC-type Fe3+ transport system, substrate-binding protein [Tindallia californiensis]